MTDRPVLVVIDARSDVFGGDEIKRVQMRTFIRMPRWLAMKAKLAILMLSHPSESGMQSGKGTSGSTGWNNGARSRLYMEKDEQDGDVLVLTTKN
jgi:RecA-family ATPase